MRAARRSSIGVKPGFMILRVTGWNEERYSMVKGEIHRMVRGDDDANSNYRGGRVYWVAFGLSSTLGS